VRNRFAAISRRDKTFLAPVNEFAFVSRATWRQFGYHVPKNRGHVVYDGIDVPDAKDIVDVAGVRKEFAIPVGARVVGMVARIAPQKDFETLIRAAARLRKAALDLRFLLIGDYMSHAPWREYRARLGGQISRAGLNDWFLFTGHRDDVGRLMGALDIFVLTTHNEGAPLVILEAMAMEKPVLATAVDGIPEVIEDGVTGLLHRHEDDAQLAEQIARLARDATLAKRIGMTAQDSVRKSFSSGHFAHVMRTLYEDVAALRDRDRPR
jgi:glycosyltransferase involved in cell wall biosynthesis